MGLSGTILGSDLDALRRRPRAIATNDNMRPSEDDLAGFHYSPKCRSTTTPLEMSTVIEPTLGSTFGGGGGK